MSADTPNFLTRLAQRALSAPAVRPRLASRFETQRVSSVDAPMREEYDERMRAAVEPVGMMQHPSHDAFQRSAGLDSRGESDAPAGEPGSHGTRLASPLVELRSLHEPSRGVQAIAQPPRLDATLALQDEQAALQRKQRALQDALSALQSALPAQDMKSNNTAPVVSPNALVDGVLPLHAPEAGLLANKEATDTSAIQLHRQALEPLIAAAPVVPPAVALEAGRTPSYTLQSLQTIASVSHAAEPAVVPIEIVIGRIEIHASEVEPRRQPPRASSSQPSPALPLAEYLQRREGRRP